MAATYQLADWNAVLTEELGQPVVLVAERDEPLPADRIEQLLYRQYQQDPRVTQPRFLKDAVERAKQVLDATLQGR